MIKAPLISDQELAARELLVSLPRTTPEENAVIIVFQAMWSYALPLDRIEKIAGAMTNLPQYIETANLEKALRFAVKRKVLRSRVSTVMGVRSRLYEVNY